MGKKRINFDADAVVNNCDREMEIEASQGPSPTIVSTIDREKERISAGLSWDDVSDMYCLMCSMDAVNSDFWAFLSSDAFSEWQCIDMTSVSRHACNTSLRADLNRLLTLPRACLYAPAAEAQHRACYDDCFQVGHDDSRHAMNSACTAWVNIATKLNSQLDEIQCKINEGEALSHTGARVPDSMSDADGDDESDANGTTESNSNVENSEDMRDNVQTCSYDQVSQATCDSYVEMAQRS